MTDQGYQVARREGRRGQPRIGAEEESADEVEAAGEVLSSEQVRVLVEEMRRGGEVGKQAQERLVLANQGLVMDIAKKFLWSRLDLQDLLQEGNIGMLRALRDYDPGRGRFSTYAIWWIRSHIQRYVTEARRLIHVPVYLEDACSQVQRARGRLEARLGREPTQEELVQETHLSAERIDQVRDLPEVSYSLDETFGEKDDLRLGDAIVDPDPFPDEQALSQVFSSEVGHVLQNVLSYREHQVLRLRYGLGNKQSLTLEQVGKKLKVTRERIRQVEARALNKLRSANELRQLVEC